MIFDSSSPMLILMLGVFAFVGWLLLIVIMLAQRKNPYIKALMQSERKNIPIVMLYKVSRRVSMHLPKRNILPNTDKKDNTLSLPEHYGVKFVPPSDKEYNLDKTKMYNYFTKLSMPLTALEAAAMTQFNNILGKYGLKDNDSVVDALIRCNLNPEKMLPGQLSELPYPIDNPNKKIRDKGGKWLEDIKEIEDEEEREQALETYRLRAITDEDAAYLEAIDEEYNTTSAEIEELENHKLELKKQYMQITGQIDPLTGEEIITLRKIQAELKKAVVEDGFFVWNIAEKFATVYSGLQAKELDEIKATFSANSMLQNFIPNDKKDMKQWAFVAIIAIIVLAALKMIMAPA